MQKLLLITLVGLFAFQSCGKKGCTDINARNYDEEAKRDDETCAYDGSIVFWLNQTSVTNAIISGGCTTFTVWYNGIALVSADAATYFNTAPDCGATNSLTCTMDLGTETSGTFLMEIKDQNGTTHWYDYYTVTNANCDDVELVW